MAVLLVMLVVALSAPGMPVQAAQRTGRTDNDSQEWAQNVCETDPTRDATLDPDGNGLAREDLHLTAELGVGPFLA